MADAFPERATRPYPSRADAFASYLQQRWAAGCRNAAQLARELKARGFAGSYHAVRRYLAHRRAREPNGPQSPSPPAAQAPSAKRVAGWLLKDAETVTPEQHTFVAVLMRQNPALQKAAQLAGQFAQLIRQRRPNELDRWLPARWNTPTRSVSLN